MAKSDHSCPTCLACDELAMPAFTFNDCLPERNESEICTIYLTYDDPANPGTAVGGPVLWTDPSDWAAAISNTGVDQVRALVGIGDLGEVEQESVIVSKRRRAFGTATHTINFTVDDTNDDNYEAIRDLACGYIVRIWYETIGGKLYGGQNGVKVTITRADAPLDRGENTFERFELSFLWEGCLPERIDTPIGETEA